MSSTIYTEPVSKLLTLGDMDWSEWDDYAEFGFADRHIPELIRLGTDRGLLGDTADKDDDEIWAPMHAWRILAQMQAMESIIPLLKVLDWIDDSDSDLISEGLLDVLEKFGSPAIEALAVLVNEPDHSMSALVGASETLARIGKAHPEHRDHVMQIITSALEEHFERNDKEVNGFWISDLLDLKATESHPVIKKAFEANKVDITIAGDLEDIEIELGLRTERETPAPKLSFPSFNFPHSMDEPLSSWAPGLKPRKAELKPDRDKIKKEKSKHKQEKKSRKKNRKRK